MICRHVPMLVPVKRFGIFLWRAECKLCGLRGPTRWFRSSALADCDRMDDDPEAGA